MRRILQRVHAARTALLTVAGFTAGTAAVWHEWGLSAGLGAMGVSFLTLEYLTGDDKKGQRS